MFVIIFEGNLTNGAIETGVDIWIQSNGNAILSDFILKNTSGKGKHFPPGEPECVYYVKIVSDLVGWHESVSSITIKVLVDMLHTLS